MNRLNQCIENLDIILDIIINILHCLLICMISLISKYLSHCTVKSIPLNSLCIYIIFFKIIEIIFTILFYICIFLTGQTGVLQNRDIFHNSLTFTELKGCSCLRELQNAQKLQSPNCILTLPVTVTLTVPVLTVYKVSSTVSLFRLYLTLSTLSVTLSSWDINDSN